MKNDNAKQTCVHIFVGRHKILFEVFSLFVIGVISTIILFFQWQAMKNQNRLIENQNKLLWQQAMPQFVISYNQILNEKIGKYDNDEILIENRGGYISDFSVENVDFLKVEYVDNSIVPNSYTNYTLPLHGYFNSEGVISTSGTGNLTRLKGFNNYARFIELQTGLRQRVDVNKRIVNLDHKHIARLSYKDITGLHHEDYYEMKSIYGGTLLSTNEGAVWFNKYKSCLGIKRGPLQLDLLAKTPELIFSNIP